MSVEPGKGRPGDARPRGRKRAAFEELFPGVLADGVLDAARLGELLDTDGHARRPTAASASG